MDIDAAYDVCEQITRMRARDRYSAIEPLPAYRRRALCAIYAFARRVDDTAHGNLSHAELLRLLADARAGIPRDGTPPPTDPVLVALRDVIRRFPISLASLDDLIDGAESDVHGATYDTFEELVQHCRQVAGSIWRLSVAVLGSRDPAATAQFADDLGVAIHLTNIVCDLVRDLERGRVYIPRGDLELFGCPADPLSAAPELLGRLIRHQTRRNRDWYDRGLALLPLLDARGAACVEAVASMHMRILKRIDRSPADVLRGRISLPAPEKPKSRRPRSQPSSAVEHRLIGSQQPPGSFQTATRRRDRWPGQPPGELRRATGNPTRPTARADRGALATTLPRRAARTRGSPRSRRGVGVASHDLGEPRFRLALARGVQRALDDARSAHPPSRSRVPVSKAEVMAAADQLDELAKRLGNPGLLAAPGLASVHLLLTDGRSPLYLRGATGKLRVTVSHALEALEPTTEW